MPCSFAAPHALQQPTPTEDDEREPGATGPPVSCRARIPPPGVVDAPVARRPLWRARDRQPAEWQDDGHLATFLWLVRDWWQRRSVRTDSAYADVRFRRRQPAPCHRRARRCTARSGCRGRQLPRRRIRAGDCGASVILPVDREQRCAAACPDGKNCGAGQYGNERGPRDRSRAAYPLSLIWRFERGAPCRAGCARARLGCS